MIMRAVAMIVIVRMVVTAARMVMLVIMLSMAAAAVFVRVIMGMVVTVIVVAARMTVLVIMIVVMPAVVIATACIFRAHGGQIEDAQNQQANTRSQYHGPEDAIRWQVGCHATADEKVKQHAAPEKQQGDAHQMSNHTCRAHNNKRIISWPNVRSLPPRAPPAARSQAAVPGKVPRPRGA